MKLDEKENTLRSPAAPADLGLSLEHHQQVVYKAGTSRLGSIYTSFVEKRELSSLMMTAGCQSKKMAIANSEERVRAAAESVAKVEDFDDVTTAALGALQPYALSAFQLSKVAMQVYCFMKISSLNKLEYLHKLGRGSALHQNEILVLADLSHSTRKARGQPVSAHAVFCKENIANTVRFVSNVMAH